jgi:hypothetical protein
LATSKKRNDLATSQPPASPATHPRIDFIKSIKFNGIGLDKCTSSVDRLLLTQSREQEVPLEIEVTISQAVLEHAEDHFVIATDFDLKQRAKGSDELIVSIAATFSARFNLVEPAPEDMVRGFASLEARLIFFPYLRHFVADISYRMSIDTIVLPLTSELAN